jgi:hypothetical protein
MSFTMKSFFTGLGLLSTIVQGHPVEVRQDDDVSISSYSSSDWEPILNSEEGASCAELAVIFARGTFDWA